MKVKNIYFGCVDNDDFTRVLALTRKNEFIRVIGNYQFNEVVSVFSGKHYYFENKEMIPLEFLLKITDDNKNISKKELKEFMVKENKRIVKILSKDKPKKVLGFKE